MWLCRFYPPISTRLRSRSGPTVLGKVIRVTPRDAAGWWLACLTKYGGHVDSRRSCRHKILCECEIKNDETQQCKVRSQSKILWIFCRVNPAAVSSRALLPLDLGNLFTWVARSSRVSLHLQQTSFTFTLFILTGGLCRGGRKCCVVGTVSSSSSSAVAFSIHHRAIIFGLGGEGGSAGVRGRTWRKRADEPTGYALAAACHNITTCCKSERFYCT